MDPKIMLTEGFYDRIRGVHESIIAEVVTQIRILKDTKKQRVAAL